MSNVHAMTEFSDFLYSLLQMQTIFTI